MAGCLVLALRTVQLVVEAQLEERRGGGGRVRAAPSPTGSREAATKDAHLLSFSDPTDAADDDFVTSLKRDHLSDAVGGTRVVDVPENHRITAAE